MSIVDDVMGKLGLKKNEEDEDKPMPRLKKEEQPDIVIKEPSIKLFPKMKEKLKEEIKNEIREELKDELREELNTVREELIRLRKIYMGQGKSEGDKSGEEKEE